MTNKIETNVDLFTLDDSDYEQVKKLYKTTPPAFIDIKRDETGVIVQVTREGLMEA